MTRWIVFVQTGSGKRKNESCRVVYSSFWLGMLQGEGALTMIGHFNELLRATADDGASASVGGAPSHSLEEIDELLEAWFQERQARIETGLFLDEAQHLLKRIIREGRMTSSCQRRATNLLLAIEATYQGSQS